MSSPLTLLTWQRNLIGGVSDDENLLEGERIRQRAIQRRRIECIQSAASDREGK